MRVVFFFCFLGLCFFLKAQSKMSSKDSLYVFYFKSASSQIKADKIADFKHFYEGFQSCQTCFFELKGFADSIGNNERNQILSQQRIAAVKVLLKNTKKERIRELPFGESLSQKTTKNQEFRKVSLKITTKETKKEQKIDTLSVQYIRYKEFNTKNKEITLNILFELNSTKIIEECENEVDILANFLKENPQLKAKLLGHVCCLDNIVLSEQRAISIKKALEKRGIEPARLSAQGFGNHRPKVAEMTLRDEQINRRVEVFFYED